MLDDHRGEICCSQSLWEIDIPALQLSVLRNPTYYLMTSKLIQRAASAILSAESVIFTSGAGLGVDSGLPDFRGPEGFWRAYPPFQALGLSFPSVSTPSWFKKDPQFAWGFWGHRYDLYTRTVPHDGFRVMKKIADMKEHRTGPGKGYFVFTSNVDGAFQKSGFPEDKVLECHGSVHWLQCVKGDTCSDAIWPSSSSLPIPVDPATFRAPSEGMPKCRKCGELARTNVLMFDDGEWVQDRNYEQERSFDLFKTGLLSRLRDKQEEEIEKVGYDNAQSSLQSYVAIIEIGAGLAVPTVRRQSEMLAKKYNGTLIRINLRDTMVPNPDRDISLVMGGKDALLEIEKEMEAIERVQG
eukprot:TRINITY_DN7571_c0_g1_i3.p1 TRINITY_DN7571_c0_g1~~TRINITY_DN7571_c0_g1_i3.p1  ORF type:complete len:354 (-),score=56.57 TRINITY_DN7571_c0_g1_i3:64-1125(-)